MIRICPKRDAVCPHGMDCPYVGDSYECGEPNQSVIAATGLGGLIARLEQRASWLIEYPRSKLIDGNLMDEAASELSRLRTEVETVRAEREAAEAECARLRERANDITDEMVVAAMNHVPGCDHDDMVDAIAAAFAARIGGSDGQSD